MPLAFALMAAACGDSEAPPVPTALQSATPAPPSAVVGSAVTAAVKVLDDKGRPMKGLAVSFAVSGGGSVAQPQVATDATGVATAAWTLGTTAGTNTLVASFASLAPVTFSVEATAGATAAMASASGNVTTAVAGSALNPAPGVQLRDQHGNPVQGALVSFSAGSGTVVGAQQTTGTDGIARPASWTLGGAAGVQNLTAISGGFTRSLNVTVTAGPPSVIEPFSGNLQVANMGQPVPIRPAVRVSDAFSNPIAGVTVQFAVTAGGGTITGSPTVSDGNGIATAGTWTLGPAPGPQTITASLPGGATATMSATAVDPGALVVERFAGHNTTCPVGTNQCSFTVVVRNGLGQTMAGETVTWTAGAQSQTTTTNAQGRATVSNLVTAATPQSGQQRARLVSNGAEVTFDYQLVQTGGYNIDLRFLDTVTPAHRTAFEQAKLRWERVITGDLSDVTFSGQTPQCPIPVLNETVEDLLVFVRITPIDGPGQVLGSAGPCWLRTSNGLPIVGLIRLDSADVAMMESNGTLLDVVIHEMGHVIGIGALWGPASQGGFGLLQGASTSDPHFTGSRAISSFQLTGGVLVNGVPVENTGGEGTRLGHWRETTFSNELMTGHIGSGGSNPLSIVTIGSLMDMGYQVNFGAADTYLMPGTSVFGLRAAGPEHGLLRLVEEPMPPPKFIR